LLTIDLNSLAQRLDGLEVRISKIDRDPLVVD
jgi:hypothetical protein